MASEQSNILKRQEQLTKWIESDTDKASKSVKAPQKIKFSNEVQFLSACNSNDWPEIQRLLNAGININCTQDDGLTSLHQACIDDNENLVKFLLDQGAEIDAKDKEGWTPLFAAISCNYLSITKYLISRGALLDTVSFDGELPLDQTTNQALITLIKEEMKQRNLDPDEVRNRERNAMLFDIELMRQTKDFSKFTLADNGGSLLHVAASKDYTDVLEQLLDIISLEQLNHTDNDGWNALHVAAHWGNKNACLLLVDADIDFDKVTANNKTVLEVSDDAAKPYIREEIRKARFRRQDRAAFKRPATFSGADSKPSDTKIICQDTTVLLPVDSNPQQPTTDFPIIKSSNPVIDSSCDSTKSKSTTFESLETRTSVDIDMKLNTDEVTCISDTYPVKVWADDEIKTAVPTSTIPVDISKENIKLENLKDAETNDVNSDKVVASVTPPSQPPKTVESESQRKDKARHIRSSRRLTQGVSLEEIEEAKKLKSLQNVENGEKTCANNTPNGIDTNAVTTALNHEDDKDTENKSEMDMKGVEAQQISDRSLNGDTPKTILTEQNSDPSDIIISISNSDSVDPGDLKKKNGSHLVNKRKTRDRQPTGIVELKDIQAAQHEFLPGLQENKLLEVFTPAEVVIDYKLMYENELREKEKLKRNLARMNRDLELSENKIKDLQDNHVISKSQIPNPVIQESSDIDRITIERLREENKRMKEANSALIRVISRLSHPQSNQQSISSSS